MKHELGRVRKVMRRDVLPGTLLIHKGKVYIASANVEKGLYIHTSYEKTVIKDNAVAILLDDKGNHLSH
ncbi:cell division protein FtsZ [Klebsiella oxytoca]|nr:cell division protein FtsZ [Klebsiella oxytoca]